MVHAPLAPRRRPSLTGGVSCTTDASSSRFVLALVAAVLLLPAAAPALTYDQAVDQLYAKGYPQNVETYLNSLGTSPLGFRLGGTSADDAAARYLAATSSAPPATTT